MSLKNSTLTECQPDERPKERTSE